MTPCHRPTQQDRPELTEELVRLINLDKLPPQLRWLCKLLGAEKAFALAQAHGGVPVTVPKVATPDHPLVDLIGLQGLVALVDAAGGTRIDMTKIDSVVRQLRRLQVGQLRAAGTSLRDMALATGYSQRHIQNIVGILEADDAWLQSQGKAPARDEPELMQMDLFEFMLPASSGQD